ncbi:MAG TPA: helix-turn-helix transcriptional regulator [Myxococcota bacterium]|nr:helix-turn-helix transcriptional regulator [Myxococcota bacterium]HRY92228.1 helix-turn-helix transcriptional regulator [Myxococcota bacterium]
MPIDSKEIGARIQSHRKALGLTQAVLAERVKLDTTYLSQVERGAKTLSLEALDRLATALHVRLGALLDSRHGSGSGQLAQELEELLEKWPAKKRKAVIQALRLLAP